jgi:hypothetical protein
LRRRGSSCAVSVIHPFDVSPIPLQSVHTPLVLMGNSGKQGDRERMEVELLQDVIDEVGAFVTFVDAVEGGTRGIHRQCWDFEGLVFRRDGGDP